LGTSPQKEKFVIPVQGKKKQKQKGILVRKGTKLLACPGRPHDPE
jgi:hypothetical protein